MADKTTVPEMLADVLSLKGASKDTQKVVDDLRATYARLAAYGSEKVKELTKSITDLSKEATTAGAFNDALSEKFSALSKTAKASLDGIAGSFGVLTTIAGTTSNALSALMTGLDSDSDNFNQNLAEMAVKTGALMAAFTGLSRAPKAFESMAQDAREASRAYEELLKGIPGIGNALQGVFEKAESAKGFENQMTKMAAQSGALEGLWGAEKLMGNASDFNKIVDKQMNNMVMLTVSAANTMGMSIQEGMKRNMEILGQLPEEMGRFYTVNNVNGLSAMQLLSTVATGTGQEFGKTIEFAKGMYAGFQTTAEEAMETFSLMSKVSNELKMNFDSVKGVVTDINGGLKQWGDNSKDIIGIMKEVTSVLREQGLGYEAGLEVTRSLAKSIGDMTIEKRAFIAMGAGMGGSPLQAGLNVERMMQKGEIGEIASMLQETLGNIGGAGRVLNLEEAATTPGMESTFLAQRQALSMFGVSDTGVANRLMDVMSKVQTGTDLGNEQQEALKAAFNKGETIQNRQFNELTVIANKIDVAVNILGVIESYSAQRALTGTKGAFGSNRQERQTEQGKIKLGGTGATTVAKYSVDMASKTKTALASLSGDITSGGGKVKEALANFGIGINDATKAIEINMKQLKEREEAKMNETNSQNNEASGGYRPPGAVGARGAPGASGSSAIPMPGDNPLVAAVNSSAAAAAAKTEGSSNQNANADGTTHRIDIFSDGVEVAKVAMNTVLGVLGITTSSGTEGRH